MHDTVENFEEIGQNLSELNKYSFCYFPKTNQFNFQEISEFNSRLNATEMVENFKTLDLTAVKGKKFHGAQPLSLSFSNNLLYVFVNYNQVFKHN